MLASSNLDLVFGIVSLDFLCLSSWKSLFLKDTLISHYLWQEKWTFMEDVSQCYLLQEKWPLKEDLSCAVFDKHWPWINTILNVKANVAGRTLSCVTVQSSLSFPCKQKLINEATWACIFLSTFDMSTNVEGFFCENNHRELKK